MEPKTVTRRSTPPILALRAKLSGFAAGTSIVTGDGLLPIDHLTPGDRVVTRDGGMQKVSWVETLYVTTFAVQVQPDALGHAKPEAKLMVPEGQRMLIRDWRAQALYGANVVGVPAWRLADGDFIKRVGPRSIRLYRVGFDRQHTVYAGGLEMLAHTKRFEVS